MSIRFIITLIATSIFIVYSNACLAQNKKKKNKEVEVIEVVDEEIPPPPPPIHEVEEDVIIEDAGYYSEYRNRQNSNRYDPKYKFEYITGQYEWYSSKNVDSYYNRTYGILKEGQILLPNIFKKGSYSYKNKENVVLKLGKSYGVYNLKKEKWLFPLEYEEIREISTNLYLISKDGMFGLMDSKKNIIIPFNYSNIRTIYEIDNYFIVSKGIGYATKKGIYNINTNSFIIPPIYDDISQLWSDLFKVTKDGKYNIIDINNKTLFKEWYDALSISSKETSTFKVKKGNYFGIIDISENATIPIEYLKLETTGYNSNIFLAKNKEGKYGFLQKDGSIKLDFNYSKLDYFGYGSSNMIATKDDKCGIVKVNSNDITEITTCEYNDIKFKNNAFIVEKNKQFGIINTYGKIITPVIYDKILFNDNTKNFVAYKGEACNLINSRGTIIENTTYKNIYMLKSDARYYGYHSNYLIYVTSNNKQGLIDKFGNKVTKPIFDEIIKIKDKNLFTVKDGKFGVFNIITRKTIIPYNYVLLVYNDKGYYIAVKNEKYLKLYIQGDTVKEVPFTY